MDSNGYGESLFPTFRCVICHRGGDLVRHEVFHGPNRKKSKALGCWVTLCPECHMKLHAQKDGLDKELKQKAQYLAMEAYNLTTEEFIGIFGKNYL